MQTDSSASHVLQVAINRGMHGDGLDAEFAAGAQDAQAISPRLAMTTLSSMGGESAQSIRIVHRPENPTSSH
jgi:hypothetical protein